MDYLNPRILAYSLLIVLAASLFGSVADAAPVLILDDYDGWVWLQTPQGHVVPYYWYVLFDDYGNVAMNASGAFIMGEYHDIGSQRVVLLYNEPYSSVFAFHHEGPRMVLDWFADRDGNRLYNSWLWVFEN